MTTNLHSTLLANLESEEHRAVVCEALCTLAKDSPEPLIRGLSDRRPRYVRNLISIIGKLKNPRFVEPLEKGEAVDLPVEEAIAIIAVCDAWRQSVETGQPIPIPISLD